MVKVYISDQDGDVHFKTVKSNSFEMDIVVQLFKANFLTYDSVSHDWTYPIRLAVLNVVDELKYNDIEVEISQEDIDVLKLTLYPPSHELRKIKIPLAKDLLEKYPPLKGEQGFEDYQLQAIRKFTTNNKSIISIYPRLGKTYISSIGLASLMKQGVVDCVFGIMRSEGLSNYKNPEWSGR